MKLLDLKALGKGWGPKLALGGGALLVAFIVLHPKHAQAAAGAPQIDDTGAYQPFATFADLQTGLADFTSAFLSGQIAGPPGTAPGPSPGYTPPPVPSGGGYSPPVGEGPGPSGWQPTSSLVSLFSVTLGPSTTIQGPPPGSQTAPLGPPPAPPPYSVGEHGRPGVR